MSASKTPKVTAKEPPKITNEPPSSNRYVANSSMTNGVVKSRKKTSLKEFSIIKGIRPEVKAGFKVWLQDDADYHFDDEWEKLFYEYNHRR